jgi:protein translocase SecG subunit
MATILPIIQIILSVTLVVAILLQTSSAGIGGAFGGGDGDVGNHSRRGFEKLLFRSTIVIAIAFALISFIIFTLS